MASMNTFDKIIMGFVGLIVTFKLFAIMLPEGQDAGDDINETGVSLGSLFVSDGILWVILLAGLFIKSYKGMNK